MDVRSGYPLVRVTSAHHPPSSRVAAAILANCLHEPQYLQDMNVAHSAANVAVRSGHQARAFLQSDELRSGLRPEDAAK